jgi:putative endonuclease
MSVKEPFVYILASQKNGTLYIGVTSNLIQRIWKHKSGETVGFAGKYEIFSLVYFEEYPSMQAAISREKQLKKWNRIWKLRLIEEKNPEWKDLWDQILK